MNNPQMPSNQESVSEIQERYHSLIENLSVGVYRNTPGPKGHFLEANPAIVSMFEANSKEEFMKHNVSDLYQHPEQRKEFVAEMMKKGEVRNRKIDLITLKGKKIVGSVTAVMKKDKKGNIYFDGIIEDMTDYDKIEGELVRYQNTLESQVKIRTLQLQEINKKLYAEISERKKAENILSTSNKALESTKQAMLNVMEDLEKAKSIIELEKAKDDAILANLGEGLIAFDNNRKVIVINKSAEEMLGWTAKEIIGKEIISLPLEDDEGNTIPFNERPICKALSTGETTENTYYLVRKDKTRFPIAIVVTPIRLNGKTIGAVDIFRDITHEMEIDRAKSEFVSLASHQLRTPLGIIKWYLEAIIEEKYFDKLPQDAKDYLEQVYNNNERLLVLVRDLLSISRIDEGKVRNTPQFVNITKIIQRVIKEMRILALKNNVTVDLKIKNQKVPDFFIDPLRLQEVIENLVTNAITYSHPDGTVTITVRQKSDTIVITIEDKGFGISKNDQKKLFTKFFRSETALAKNTEGSGLGLYLVKSYVDGWNGKISVKSAEGKGSTFSITLPIKMKEGDMNK